VLYEAATGRPAFEDDEAEATTWQTEDQVDAGFPQLLGPAPRATGPLAEAIEAALAFDPADRPSMLELAALLTPHAPGAQPWSG
jgi:hypothetical protein